MRKLVFAVLLSSLFASGVTGCKSSGSSTPYLAPPQVTAVEVTPSDTTIALNTGQQFTATAVFSDNSTRDVTSEATWTSSDPSIAAVSPSGATVSAVTTTFTTGTLFGIAEGSTLIKATWNGVSGTGHLKVKRAGLSSIAVTPTAPAIAKGTMRVLLDRAAPMSKNATSA